MRLLAGFACVLIITGGISAFAVSLEHPRPKWPVYFKVWSCVTAVVALGYLAMLLGNFAAVGAWRWS